MTFSETRTRGAARPSAPALPARELTITRLIDAPPALVFAAWTDPARLARWWGPKHFTNPVCDLDVRPGGKLRIVMRSADGIEYPMIGVYQEIVAPERLVFTNIAVDRDDKPILKGLTTVTFAAHAGRTKLTLHTTATAVVAGVERMLEGMEAGWTQSLERLDALLAEGYAASNVLLITRLFDAPRTLVFKAWTEREHGMRWAGPRGFTATHMDADLRPGGKWRTCLRRDSDGLELCQGGVYREVVPCERLVFTFAWDPAPGMPDHETLVTITFADQQGKTLMTFRQEIFESTEQRDGHVAGWGSAFDRLAELVETL
jgi:uncharacterized protein YndB with AHSA1/START domain